MSSQTITMTMLQEVMFELYDVSNGETSMSKSLAKELADKLAELEIQGRFYLNLLEYLQERIKKEKENES